MFQLRKYKQIYLLSNNLITKFTDKLSKWNVKVIEETKALGNAGCLKNLQKFNDDILVISGDLIFNFDIERYVNFHKKKE